MKDSTPEELARSYASEGLDAFYDRKMNKAALSIQAALNLFKETGNGEEYVKNLNLLGVIYAAMGNEAMAVDFYLEGLEYALTHKLHHMALLFYNNIGSSYITLNEHEKAITYFKKSEVELEYEDVKKYERYECWYLITKLNLMLSYSALEQFEKAEAYLKETERYAESEKNIEYHFSFMVTKCQLYWRIGKKNEVYEIIDELVEEALHDGSASDYETDMQEMCKLLKEMGEYEKWKRIIQSFENYAKEQGTVFVQLTLTEMWMDYYKTIDDREKYIHLCVNHAELIQKQKEITDKERAAAIDIKIELQEKEAARRRAEQKSNTDSLTDLGNRYMLKDDIRSMTKKCMELNLPIAIGILDVDCFKEHNDTYGHLQGDDSLRRIAEILKDVANDVGQVYRFGGDEFVVLIQNATESGVEEIAAAIKARISELNIENKNSRVMPELTISQGYSIYIPKGECVIESLLEEADKALYQAKKNGKNGYVICRPLLTNY